MASVTSCECTSFQPTVTVHVATVPSVIQPRLNCPPPADPLPPPVGRDWHMASDEARLQVAVRTPWAAEPHPTLKVAEPKPKPEPSPVPMPAHVFLPTPAELLQEPGPKPAPAPVEVVVSLPAPAELLQEPGPKPAPTEPEPGPKPAPAPVEVVVSLPTPEPGPKPAPEPEQPAADDSEEPAIGPLKSITDIYVHDKGRLPHQESKDGKYAWIRKSSQDSDREVRKLAAELTRILACTDGGPDLGWLWGVYSKVHCPPTLSPLFPVCPLGSQHGRQICKDAAYKFDGGPVELSCVQLLGLPEAS